jgi:hypothetical protein
MNGYQLTDAWFEFRFQHPDKVSHSHTELYFYLVYHWNKLSQKEKFGLPSAVTMEATGIKNYKTYSKCLKDLVEFGFIRIVQEAINQHQAVVVAWGKNTKADTEALTEALTKAQHEALPHIVELNNLVTNEPKKEIFDLSDLSKFESKYDKQMLADFQAYWTETDQKGKMRFQAEKFFDVSRRLATWNRNQSSFGKNQNSANTSFPAENSPSWRPSHHKNIDFSNTIETK